MCYKMVLIKTIIGVLMVLKAEVVCNHVIVTTYSVILEQTYSTMVNIDLLKLHGNPHNLPYIT